MSRIDSVNAYRPEVGLQKMNAGKRAEETSQVCNTVAGVSGAAGVPESAASAVCSFSEESLERLSKALESGYETVESAIEDSAEWIGDTLESAADGAVSLYTEVAEMAEDGVDAVGDAVSAVSDGIGSVASKVAGYGTMALAAGREFLREVI